MAKKRSHQRHLSKKELCFRVPNQRLQAGMESVTKSLFNQKYCFNSFMEIVIFIFFYWKFRRLTRKFMVGLCHDGWLCGRRFVHESRGTSLALTYRLDIPHSKLRGIIYRLLPWSRSVPEKQTFRYSRNSLCFMEPEGSFCSSKSLSLDDDTSWQNRVDFMRWFSKKHVSLS